MIEKAMQECISIEDAKEQIRFLIDSCKKVITAFGDTENKFLIQKLSLEKLLEEVDKLDKIKNKLKTDCDRLTLACYPHEVGTRYYIEDLLKILEG